MVNHKKGFSLYGHEDGSYAKPFAPPQAGHELYPTSLLQAEKTQTTFVLFFNFKVQTQRRIEVKYKVVSSSCSNYALSS